MKFSGILSWQIAQIMHGTWRKYVTLAVWHVCVCNHKCGCVFVSLQLFLPLQQTLSRLVFSLCLPFVGGEEIIHDVSVASVKTVFKAAMSRMTGY